jgi:glycosyltransferase involved in cell wall biosynthesis
MGCDFNFWVPGDKKIMKKYFKLDPSITVFSMASRFNELKQIDKIINVFSEIENQRDFNYKLIIAGHGDAHYENYLRKIASRLIKKKKLEFLGYLPDQQLLNLYQASDLFISASISEGGPVSVIKAIACGIPVMCTRVRGVDDILNQYQAGLLVDQFDYRQWKEIFINILTGGINIKLMDREAAKGIFDWSFIASKFAQIYKKIFKLY